MDRSLALVATFEQATLASGYHCSALRNGREENSLLAQRKYKLIQCGDVAYRESVHNKTSKITERWGTNLREP